MDPLFPQLPEDVKALSDDELAKLLEEHVEAARLIDADDEKFLEGLSANEVIAQYEKGVSQIKLLGAEQVEREEAHKAYQAKKAELSAEIAPVAEEETAPEEPEEDDGAVAEPPVEVVAEEETPVVEEEQVEEKELVLASVEPTRLARRPPTPSPERTPKEEPQKGTALVAAGDLANEFKNALDGDSLAEMVIRAAMHYGPVNPKTDAPGAHGIFDGPSHKLARAEFEFPPERVLGKNEQENLLKLQEVVVESLPGVGGRYSLTASGGLCAPLEPIYTMPNFASTAEPVWESLPIFRADRGGVNVPTATDITSITTAISSISEANDALGGTFATKTCQDLECPAYTEVAVQILAHCREYGNLNARAWPEKIRHENELTMAALARTSETFILDRIKALSINVTQAEILGAYADLVHALTKAAAGIRFRLRMPRGSRFNVVIPEWVADLLAADVAMTQFDRYQAQAAMVAHLESLGFRVTLYKDDVTGGTSQGFAAEAAGALDDFPDDVQYAIYPEGQFIGIDMGVLELGIVRDSTLNSTNDFQVFGERFRNLAMLGPAQGALWVTQGICPSGEFPALGTALSC